MVNKTNDPNRYFTSTFQTVCPFSKKTGHGAGCCDENTRHNYKCEQCRKIDHNLATCWSCTGGRSHRVSLQGFRSENEGEGIISIGARNAGESVGVVTEDENMISEAKQCREGQSFTKRNKDASMDIRSLINPSQELSDRQHRKYVKKKPQTRSKGTKKTLARPNVSIVDHLGMYDIMSELSREPAV